MNMASTIAPAPVATERRITRKSHAPEPVPAFAGPGHMAVEVLASRPQETDPFVLLMDDRLDFHPGQVAGGEHPHAGLETVTLMLEGGLDGEAKGPLQAGDLEWMTAGRGIIHGENVRATGRTRALQLWVALPTALRHMEPEVETVAFSSVPVRREPGAEIRLYSGRSGDLVSPTRNRVPITIADVHLQPGATVTQTLPARYSGLLYVIDGSLEAGGMALAQGDIGWIDVADPDATELPLAAGPDGGRAILYAGQPLKEPIVQHGPFVAGSPEEIAAFYRTFRQGEFSRLTQVAAEQ
jgi:redox-sensitive bicupin YhaK (pirin superfamily)